MNNYKPNTTAKVHFIGGPEDGAVRHMKFCKIPGELPRVGIKRGRFQYVYQAKVFEVEPEEVMEMEYVQLLDAGENIHE